MASLEILADQRFEVALFLLTGWTELATGVGQHAIFDTSLELGLNITSTTIVSSRTEGDVETMI